jgi:hypothetical protein
LLQAIQLNECVLVLGPGVSLAAGRTPWSSFLRGISATSLEDLAAQQKLLHLLDVGKIDDVVDSLNASLPPGALAERIAQCVRDERPGQGFTELRLSEPLFSGVVSVNIDPTASDIWRSVFPKDFYSYYEAEGCLEVLAKKQFFVLALNGQINLPAPLLLSQQELLDALAQSAPLRDLLRRLYYTRSMLFLGFTLEELRSFLRLINRPGPLARHHFALTAVTGTAWEPVAANLWTHFGVRVVPYSPRETGAR